VTSRSICRNDFRWVREFGNLNLLIKGISRAAKVSGDNCMGENFTNKF
jgi:hypothetical protein